MPLRRPADWMQPADDRLLEYYDSEGASGVGNIYKSGLLDYEYETIRLRSSILAKAGFLDKIGDGSYAITKQGRRYLEGFDFSDMDPPEESG